jgi:ABC-type dipeptide/oligopeptide/nickel transport system permease component
MAKKSKTKSTKIAPEPDGVYLLKIVLYFLLGTMWLQVGDSGIAIPVGFIFGLLLASHDHFKIDRKIEYAVLLFAAVLSFIAPIGFVLSTG